MEILRSLLIYMLPHIYPRLYIYIYRLRNENVNLYSSLNSIKTSLLDEKNNSDSKIFTLSKEIETLKNNLNTANENIKSSSRENEQQVMQLIDQMKVLKSERSKNDSVMSKLQSQLDESSESLKKCQTSRDQFKQNYHRSAHQLDECNQEKNNLEAELLQRKEMLATEYASKIKILQTGLYNSFFFYHLFNNHLFFFVL